MLLTLEEIWSEKYKRLQWRKFWLALARSQSVFGLVTAEQVNDLAEHVNDVDVEASMKIEKVTRHDLMAEVKYYASQCPVGGGIIHLGATSSDVEENVDAVRLRESLLIILRVMYWMADFTEIPDSHYWPIKEDVLRLGVLESSVKGKGVKGAVGTSASYAQLLEGSGRTARDLEDLVMSLVGIKAFQVATQIAPRKQEYLILSGLFAVGMTICSLAVELRELGVMDGRTVSKIFSRQNMNSSFVDVAWHNASHSLLERTLDDSANRRYIIPVFFINLFQNIEAIYSALGKDINENL